MEVGHYLQHCGYANYRIIDLASGSQAWTAETQARILDHFQSIASPIMCGGTTDNFSRALLGIRIDRMDPQRSLLLVLDPHHYALGSEGPVEVSATGRAEFVQQLAQAGRYGWRPVTEMLASSHYNLLCPLPGGLLPSEPSAKVGSAGQGIVCVASGFDG